MYQERGSRQYCITQEGNQFPVFTRSEKIVLAVSVAFINCINLLAEIKPTLRMLLPQGAAKSLKDELRPIRTMFDVERDIKRNSEKGRIVPGDNNLVRDLTLEEMKIKSCSVKTITKLIK